MKQEITRWIKKYPVIKAGTGALCVLVLSAGFFSINNSEDREDSKAYEAMEVPAVQTVPVPEEKQTVYKNGLSKLVEGYGAVPPEEVFYYQLTVGDEKLVFETIEDLESALRMVQQEALGLSYETDVDVISTDEGYETISSASKKFTLKGILDDHILSTSSATVDAAVMGAESEGIAVETVGKEFVPSDPETVEEDKPQTLISFYEEVEIDTVSRTAKNPVTPEEAAAILNRTNETPKQYEVESGDSPYTIAMDHDMTLNELYALNEGLEEKAKGLKVGDLVTVEVLTPQLSLVIEEETTYYDTVIRGVLYKEDDTLYKTVEKEASACYDGTKKVTAIVKTMNGEEIGREILTETVVIEPQDAVVLVGTKPLPTSGPVGTFIIPIKSYIITSPFGTRWGSFHTGVDLAADYGTTIYASDGGDVTVAGWSGGYGYMVEIDHGDGRVTRYAHCSKLLVSAGQEVGQGQPIAELGNSGNSTGPHVHFEVIIDGDPQNPMDYVLQ